MILISLFIQINLINNKINIKKFIYFKLIIKFIDKIKVFIKQSIHCIIFI